MAQTNGWGQAHINNTISFGGDVACGGGPSFDADYQAVLDYATTQGYSLPSAGQQTLQNTLVTDLKTAGVWAKLDAFGVRAVDGDSNFALIDWKRLLTTTAINSPTFTTNVGFTGDGATSYIDNLYNPSVDAVNYTLNSASIGTYLQDDGGSGASGFVGYFGHAETTPLTKSAFISSFNTTKIGRINTDVSGVSTSSFGNNFYLLSRTSSASVTMYADGSVLQTASSTSTSLINNSLFSLTRGLNGAIGAPNTYPESLFCIGGDLSAEAADFNTAVSTYLAAI